MALKWFFLFVAFAWLVLKYMHVNLYSLRYNERISYKWLLGYQKKDIDASRSEAKRQFMRISNTYSAIFFILMSVTLLLFAVF